MERTLNASDRNGLSKVLNQSVVIDNKAGASGAIGSVEVKRSAPDGYTVLFSTASSLALYNLMATKPQYDYLKDFITIAVVGGSAVVIMANKSAPQTLNGLDASRVDRIHQIRGGEVEARCRGHRAQDRIAAGEQAG